MHIKVSSAICFNLDQSKILLSGNGLIPSGQENLDPSMLRTICRHLRNLLQYIYEVSTVPRNKAS